jgi:hypothetical protein
MSSSCCSLRGKQTVKSLTQPREIQSRETDLAAMQPPTGLDSNIRAAVTQSILRAFVYGFRVVMLFCSALSLAGCLVAWLMIPKNPRETPDAAHD